MPIPGQPNPGTLSSTATLSKGARWRPAASGGGIRQVTLKEAASQTFDAFELVSIDSAGNVTNLGALADPAANAVSSSMSTNSVPTQSTLVYGMALDPASNAAAISTTNNIRVIVADDATEFFLRLFNSTGTSCEVQDVAIGAVYELKRYGGASISTTVRDAQTVVVVPANGTDGINKVVLTEIPLEWAATDTYAGVWVKVRKEARGEF